MTYLQQITSEHAAALKTARLRSLQDTPTAFGSTYEDESQFGDVDWLKRASDWNSDRVTGYLALDQEVPCGLIRGYIDEENPERAYVASMWVAPAYRRAGLGSDLMNAVQRWAEVRNVRQIRLMVTNINKGAISFYERQGFSLTGLTEPYPNDPALRECEMLKLLRRG